MAFQAQMASYVDKIHQAKNARKLLRSRASFNEFEIEITMYRSIFVWARFFFFFAAAAAAQKSKVNCEA